MDESLAWASNSGVSLEKYSEREMLPHEERDRNSLVAWQHTVKQVFEQPELLSRIMSFITINDLARLEQVSPFFCYQVRQLTQKIDSNELHFINSDRLKQIIQVRPNISKLVIGENYFDNVAKPIKKCLKLRHLTLLAKNVGSKVIDLIKDNESISKGVEICLVIATDEGLPLQSSIKLIEAKRDLENLTLFPIKVTKDLCLQVANCKKLKSLFLGHDNVQFKEYDDTYTMLNELKKLHRLHLINIFFDIRCLGIVSQMPLLNNLFFSFFADQIKDEYGVLFKQKLVQLFKVFEERRGNAKVRVIENGYYSIVYKFPMQEAHVYCYQDSLEEIQFARFLANDMQVNYLLIDVERVTDQFIIQFQGFNYLKKLELKCANQIPFELIDKLAIIFPSLESLTITGCIVSLQKDRVLEKNNFNKIKELAINTNIKIGIKWLNNYVSMEDFINLVIRFPSLESLDVCCIQCTSSFFDFASQLKCLRKVGIDFIYPLKKGYPSLSIIQRQMAHMTSLKALTIRAQYGLIKVEEEDFNCTFQLPVLEELNFYMSGHLPRGLYNLYLSFVRAAINLKSLHIGVTFIHPDELILIIREVHIASFLSIKVTFVEPKIWYLNDTHMKAFSRLGQLTLNNVIINEVSSLRSLQAMSHVYIKQGLALED